MAVVDDDEKIRRNIVVASAAVILASWLRLPLTDIGERFLSVKASCEAVGVSEFRVWAAVLAILAYLGLRYFWSKEVIEAREDLQNAYETYYKKLLVDRYLPEVERWSVRRCFPKNSHPDLAKILRSVVLEPAAAEEGTTVELRSLEYEIGNVYPSLDKFRVKVTAHNVLNGGDHINIENLNLPIDRHRHKLLKMRSRLYSHIWSKGSMSMLWPVGLWAIAGSICVSKLILIANDRWHFWV